MNRRAGSPAGTTSRSEADIPVVRRPGCLPPATSGLHPRRGFSTQMLRLQSPLPEAYTDATPEALADRIAAAKSTLGSRVFILGHHYQRDEVMRCADARGDSFGLSRI